MGRKFASAAKSNIALKQWYSACDKVGFVDKTAVRSIRCVMCQKDLLPVYFLKHEGVIKIATISGLDLDYG